MRRWRARKRAVALLAAVATLFVAALVVNLVKSRAGYPAPLRHSAASACTEHWVGTWAASPSGVSLTHTLADQTARMIVAPHLGGSTLRVHLTNRYGKAPVKLGPVTVGLRGVGAALVAGSERSVTFGGRRSIVLAPGADAVSDPVELSFGAFRELAISLFVPGKIAHPNEHLVTRQTNYLSPRGSGDHSAQSGASAFTEETIGRGFSSGWYFLDGIDVLAPGPTGAVVTFGDSITDGYQARNSSGREALATINTNTRWPDELARRLIAAAVPLSVLNAGISGDKLLRSGLPAFGLSGLARFRPDVLEQAGVTDVVVLMGINDIALGATASQLIAGYEQLIDRAHAAGVAIQLGTLTPSRGTRAPAYGDLAAQRVRLQVNRWIRTQRFSDGIVDFDAAVRDPSEPRALDPADDGGDHLHLSPAGNAAMARAVNLAALARPNCLPA